MHYSPPLSVAGGATVPGASTNLRTIDTNEATGHLRLRTYRFVHPPRQRNKIGIESADDDASVIRMILVKTNEMLAVEREQDAVFSAGKGQYVGIRSRTVRSARVLDRHDIVAQPS